MNCLFIVKHSLIRTPIADTDLFQEGEMKANREEVFEMKGDGAEMKYP